VGAAQCCDRQAGAAVRPRIVLRLAPPARGLCQQRW
jgi:hypothetical protein